jgi:hypothetical protein
MYSVNKSAPPYIISQIYDFGVTGNVFCGKNL